MARLRWWKVKKTTKKKIRRYTEKRGRHSVLSEEIIRGGKGGGVSRGREKVEGGAGVKVQRTPAKVARNTIQVWKNRKDGRKKRRNEGRYCKNTDTYEKIQESRAAKGGEEMEERISGAGRDASTSGCRRSSMKQEKVIKRRRRRRRRTENEDRRGGQRRLRGGSERRLCANRRPYWLLLLLVLAGSGTGQASTDA